MNFIAKGRLPNAEAFRFVTIAGQPAPDCGLATRQLGSPLTIREVARMIGCSAWTVRQSLIPRGLPYFRASGQGRLIFYEAQIVGWIEQQQRGK